MKRISLRLAVATLTLILGVTSFFALNRVRQQVSRERVKAEAVRLTKQFHEAVFAGDTSTLNNILAEDFKGISRSHSGEFTVSKAEQLAASKKGKEAQGAAGEPVPSMTLSNVNVYEAGATIVVEADAMFVSDKEYRSHLIYAFGERQGRLQLISSEYKL